MKKQLLTVFGATVLCLNSFAQQRDPNLIPCATYDAMEEVFKNNPDAKSRYNLVQSQLDLEYQEAIANISAQKTAATVYTVPVVFHVMGPQVISDQTFIDLITYINDDYAKTGSDVATINPTFSSSYVDSEIRFALAQRDPTGKCTNGIIRHNSDNITWNQSSPAYNYSGNGTNRWPTNQYLNVYIVDCISGPSNPCPPTGSYIGGYTYLPGTWGTNAKEDAIVMLKSQLAQSNPHDSRTLSHEMGHWLNLKHTFGNSNSPGTGTCGSASLNDGVSDTPETKGYFSTCPSTFSGDCTSLPNIENIMDYSSCPKMFTQGQVTRMRSAITSATSGRSNLWTAANYSATGLAGGYTCTPVADLKANKLKNCVGSVISYSSTSQVGTSGGVVWTFEGGTPATSTSTSQNVTYATPGTYSVSITATNTSGTNTMNKVSYITITNGTGGITAPNAHDIETTGVPSNITVVNNNGASVAWGQNTATGANSTSKSMYLNNASTSGTAGHIDWFETPFYNFSNTTNISLSYYYAYAKKVAAQVDSFKVQYSLDCGGTWTNVVGIPSISTMATNSGGTTSTAFVPSAAQWKQTNIVSALLSNLNNKPSVKFRFYFRNDMTLTSSNNIYIDQININGTVTVGITELENNIGLLIYPNPTNASATVDFNVNTNDKVKISVIDLLGKVLEENQNLDASSNKVNYVINKNGQLAQGIYIVNIDVNGQRLSKKLIIE